MSFLLSLITGFLSLYLAFANLLADTLLAILPTSEVGSTTVATTGDQTSTLTQIDSEYETDGPIPQILIDNAAYQEAAVSSAVYPEATATPAEALVNIFCTYRTAQYERTTTGTGFFIHPDGIILTNAHVAQLMLLANVVGDSECVIRTGAPATPTYTAELLYISPAWVRQHASIVNEDTPRGTGERDYALLYVNSGLNNRPMPRIFPALSFDTELLRVSAAGADVIAAGYPAGALRERGSDLALVPQVAETRITELMTFNRDHADLMTIAGSPVGQSGASGGPVVDEEGNAIGVIVTRGDDEQFGVGSLRALTISYIDRTMQEETGVSLLQNITGDLPFRAQLYRETMVPFLEQVIRWELE